jgi:transposase
MMPVTSGAGLTVRDVAKRYRVSPDKVRGWIKCGELPAINTSTTRCGKPRFVILPKGLEQFEHGRQAGPAANPPKRRKRHSAMVDFYPD